MEQTQQKKKHKKRWLIALAVLLGLGIIVGASVGSTLPHHQANVSTPKITTSHSVSDGGGTQINPKPSILSTNNDIYYYQTSSSSLFETQQLVNQPSYWENLGASITLHNPKNYKIKASYTGFDWVIEQTQYLSSTLSYKTNSNNTTLSFTLPITNLPKTLQGWELSIFDKGTFPTSITIHLEFLNNDNEVISDYNLSQTFNIVEINLSPYFIDAVGLNNFGFQTGYDMNYNPTTKTLSGSNNISYGIDNLTTQEYINELADVGIEVKDIQWVLDNPETDTPSSWTLNNNSFTLNISLIQSIIAKNYDNIFKPYLEQNDKNGLNYITLNLNFALVINGTSYSISQSTNLNIVTVS